MFLAKGFEKMKLTKSPKIDIRYGMQTQENRKEWVNWVFENLAVINLSAAAKSFID